MTTDQQEFVLKCKAYLEKKWKKVTAAFEQGKPQAPLGEGHSLTHLIRDCLTSVIKTYHYVLPTQLLAKSVSPDLDAHSLQVAYSSAKVHRSLSVNSDGSLDSEKLKSLAGLKPEIIDGF